MKRRISNFLLLLVGIAFIAVSCTSKYPGFKKSKTGIYYKFHVKNEKGKKPKMEDVLTMSLLIKTADTVLIDSKKSSRDMMIPLSKSDYKGDINECFAMLNEGDSASFKINADSLILKTFRMPSLPKKIKKGSDVTITVKLKKVQTKAQLEAERNEMMDKQFETSKSEFQKYLTDNKITTPNVNGVYFIETAPGKGAKIEKGKKVSMNLIVNDPTGQMLYSTAQSGKPYEFQVGQQHQLTDIDPVIEKMKVGGKATILMEPKMAQMPNGATVPQGGLILNVEILSVQ